MTNPDYDATISYLELESEKWVGFRDRAERGLNLDSQLNQRRNDSMTRINLYLEDLFELNVTLGFEQAVA